MQAISTGNISTTSTTFSAAANDDEYMVNGKNVMRLPATEPYNFGFQLLDMFFTKEELSKSPLYESKKSDKPALDPLKVEKVLSLVNKRYRHKDNWDENTLVKKLNQKCRDCTKEWEEETKEFPKS